MIERPPLPVLHTPRLCVHLPPPDDAPALLAYFAANDARFAPFDPPHPPGFLTLPFWRGRLAQNRAEAHDDRSYRFFLRSADDPTGPVLGAIGLTGIARGPSQRANVGFSVDGAHEGIGLMREALEAVLGLAWGPLALHRLEAGHLPDNHRSAGLLARLGFAVEGYAPRYLFINGAWRDHVLRAAVSPLDLPPQR